MEDNDQKQKLKREIDRFSKFMFGNRTHHSKEKSHNNDWFFGRRRKETETKKEDSHPPQNKVEDFMNNVDIEKLFETYDTFVTTKEQLKPFLKEIAPFIGKFTNKFKK
ncbi:hypothetical protein KW850_27445 [Bacillus sp. sid0103]|uniref:hypothetical protein n=1 Tax=Bacillus sp. sid0103 TaxID=2856337 RepID=UPI001C47CB33|nr:hypothetical protein [Bacillus sp. sid0103]MBV7508942.1 hypothetical protein [Bacillus sp. sid0103]